MDMGNGVFAPALQNAQAPIVSNVLRAAAKSESGLIWCPRSLLGIWDRTKIGSPHPVVNLFGPRNAPYRTDSKEDIFLPKFADHFGPSAHNGSRRSKKAGFSPRNFGLLTSFR